MPPGKHLYEIAIDSLRDDSARFWVVYNVMSVVNGGLFAFMNSTGSPHAIRLITCGLGIVLCAVWYGIQSRLRWYLDYWDKKAAEFEPEYQKQVGDDKPALRLFQGLKGGDHKKTGMSTRLAGRIMPLVFGLAWCFVFVYLVWTHVSSPSGAIDTEWLR